MVLRVILGLTALVMLSGCLPSRLNTKGGTTNDANSDVVSASDFEFDSQQQLDSLLADESNGKKDIDPLQDSTLDAGGETISKDLTPLDNYDASPDDIEPDSLNTDSDNFDLTLDALDVEAPDQDGGHADDDTELDSEDAPLDQQIGLDVLVEDGIGDTVITAPSTIISSKPEANTNQKTASFSFSCDKPQCTYECKLDDDSWKECNGGSASYTALSDKTHTFSVRAGYQGMVESPATSYQWKVDTIAPVVTITNQPVLVSNIRTATIEFTCNEIPCTINCQIDGGIWKECSSPVVLNDLTLGEHSMKVQGVDPAGNLESTPHLVQWTVLGWTSVSADFNTTCAISTEETLFCWGKMLGYDGLTSSVFPRQIGLEKWTHVSVALNFNCMVRADKTLWCFGDNAHGQLGTGTTGGSSDVLVQEKSKSEWLTISTGSDSVCAIKSDNTLWCWGWNIQGQLGLGDLADTSVNAPTRVETASNWSQISMNNLHSCGLRGNALYCWGDNENGRIGNAKTTGFEKLPVKIGADEWLSVSVGSFHTCAIKTNGTLWCWGRNWTGQLGNNDTNGNSRDTPTKIGLDTDWTHVQCGSSHTCARKSNQTMYCWGRDAAGGLGIGSTSGANVYKPEKLAGNDWSGNMGPGQDHTCAIRADNTLWCWGWKDGPLGITVPTNDVTAPDRQIEFYVP